MTKQFLVVGDPIDHSKSPDIHRAAYGVLGLDWTYGRLLVQKNDLRQVLDNAPEALYGFSVTMPLKEEAARNVAFLDDYARKTGAANTIVKTDRGWSGYNTDVFGVMMALKGVVTGPIRSVGVVGAGATARSALVAINSMNLSTNVWIFCRSKESFSEIKAFAKPLGFKLRRAKTLRALVKRAGLTVSTLPAGALDAYLSDSRIQKVISGPLFDVAYNPWPSQAAKVWMASGNKVVSGIEMLIWQAVAQLRLFVNGDLSELPNEVAVVEAMRHAAE